MSRSSPPQFSLWQARLYSLRSCVFCPLRLLHAKKNVRCARWRVRDRKVTLWGRTPSCRLRCLWLRRELKTSCAGRSEFPPPYSFKMKIADLIWRKMCREGGDPSNRQTGGLPHGVTFLSHTQKSMPAILILTFLVPFSCSKGSHLARICRNQSEMPRMIQDENCMQSIPFFPFATAQVVV